MKRTTRQIRALAGDTVPCSTIHEILALHFFEKRRRLEQLTQLVAQSDKPPGRIVSSPSIRGLRVALADGDSSEAGIHERVCVHCNRPRSHIVQKGWVPSKARFRLVVCDEVWISSVVTESRSLQS